MIKRLAAKKTKKGLHIWTMVFIAVGAVMLFASNPMTVQAASANTQAIVKSLSKQDRAEMSDDQKAYYLHDQIISKFDFESSKQYADTFKKAAKQLGVKAITVSGNGRTWNMVKVGKEWLHVDLEADESTGSPYHDFCLVSGEDLEYLDPFSHSYDSAAVKKAIRSAK